MQDRLNSFIAMLDGSADCDESWYNEKFVMHHLDAKTPMHTFAETVKSGQCTNGNTCVMLCDFDEIEKGRINETIAYYDGISTAQMDKNENDQETCDTILACFPTTIAAYACIGHICMHNQISNMNSAPAEELVHTAGEVAKEQGDSECNEEQTDKSKEKE